MRSGKLSYLNEESLRGIRFKKVNLSLSTCVMNNLKLTVIGTSDLICFEMTLLRNIESFLASLKRLIVTLEYSNLLVCIRSTRKPTNINPMDESQQ